MNFAAITPDDMQLFLQEHQPPCISVYMPTHRRHPENQQDPIRYRNMLKSLGESTILRYSANEAEAVLAPLRKLANDLDFWNHTWDGLGIFSAVGVFRVYRLQRPVSELAIAANSFHLTPMLRVLQSVDRYQVLSLNRKEIRLFEGDRHTLDEVELAPGVPRTITEALGDELTEPHQTVASYGGTQFGSDMRHSHGGRAEEEEVDEGRFFRAVDRAIREHHSRPSGLPLIVAALTEYHSAFRQVSHNPFLLEKGIEVDASALSKEQLCERAWAIVEPALEKRLSKLAEDFESAHTKGLGSDDVAVVANAAAASRVDSLLVEADRRLPGRLENGSGGVTLLHLEDPHVDDLLDDVAELVLSRGGKVTVISAEQMPTRTGIAATFRY
ncbi:MAG: hypothetical protein KIT83_07370 [Bryobacterales bacterium]|nr:hypothetical protein [Bryobacterales bacterium]